MFDAIRLIVLLIDITIGAGDKRMHTADFWREFDIIEATLIEFQRRLPAPDNPVGLYPSEVFWSLNPFLAWAIFGSYFCTIQLYNMILGDESRGAYHKVLSAAYSFAALSRRLRGTSGIPPILIPFDMFVSTLCIRETTKINTLVLR